MSVSLHLLPRIYHCFLDCHRNMPKTAFVTGATGLLGRQVLRAFDHAGWRAVGSGFTRAKPPILKVDLEDQDAIDAALDETKYALI